MNDADVEDATPERRRETIDVDPRALRQAPQLNQALPIATRWVALLPGEIAPVALLRRFPRIANIIARSWEDRESIAKYLDDLLVDRRGSRKGFPPDVHVELLTLQDYLNGRYPIALPPA